MKEYVQFINPLMRINTTLTKYKNQFLLCYSYEKCFSSKPYWLKELVSDGAIRFNYKDDLEHELKNEYINIDYITLRNIKIYLYDYIVKDKEHNIKVEKFKRGIK